MGIVKGKNCICKVLVGFPGNGFCTILEGLPNNEVEDSSLNTPVVFDVYYG